MIKKIEQLEALKSSSVAMVDAINYNRWTFDKIKPYLGRDILEIGAGTGSITELMADEHRVVTLDNSAASITFLQERFRQNQKVEVYSGDICDQNVVTCLLEKPIDTIVCMNVLEHIEDDTLALQHMKQVLPNSSGKLILLVPAFQFLYGSVDAVGGHYRRYNSQDLYEKLIKVGFRIVKHFYMNSLGIIGWFITCKIIKEENITGKSIKFQTSIYDKWAVPLLSQVESIVSLPFGLSIIYICEL